MSSVPDQAPKQGFQISQLLYDTRYRSMTIQVIATILILSGFWWLAANAVANLAALGKPIQFRFLGDPSNYDIGQKLLEYSSRDTHFKAALLGILNTLLVAVLGCITATIIGVLVGVLRLSNNWLVARLMTVYIEIFRNVPVLLWILIVFGVMIHTMPAPKDFKTGEASMILFQTVAVTKQGVFIPRLVSNDMHWIFFAVGILSIVGVFWLRKRADRIQAATGDRPKTLFPSIGVLIIPMLIAYLAITAITTNQQQELIVRSATPLTSLDDLRDSKTKLDFCVDGGQTSSVKGMDLLRENDFTFRRKEFLTKTGVKEAFANGTCSVLAVKESEAAALQAELAGMTTAKDKAVSIIPADFTTGPAIGAEVPGILPKGIPRFEGGTHIRNPLIALWLALSLYTAAFIAENVRSGIQAISRGQTEAAYALGMQPGRTMNLVILPQALRVIIPPLISQYLNLTKNSSLAIAVGYLDITGTLMGITLNQTGREMETILLGMLIYLTISLSISSFMNWYNNRMQLVER